MTDISHKIKIKEADQFCHTNPELPGSKSGTSGFARQNWLENNKSSFHHILSH